MGTSVVLRASLALVLLAVGCFEVDLEPDRRFPRYPGGDAGDAAAVDASAVDAGVVDAAQHMVLGEHPDCAEPLRASSTDSVFVPAEGFSGEDLGYGFCSDDVPTLARCDRSDPCPGGGLCVSVAEGRRGYCLGELDGLGDEDLLTFRDGRCRMLVPRVFKRALCCAKAAGVDCRRYPFATKSRPGERCLEQDDCETGLRCAPLSEDPLDSEVGICLCPGVASNRVSNSVVCAEEIPRKAWGHAAAVLPVSACQAALVDGFVEESLFAVGEYPPDDGASQSPLRVTLARNGLPYVALLTNAGRVHVIAPEDRTWPASVTLEEAALGLGRFDLGLEQAAAFALAFAEDGALHVVVSDPSASKIRVSRFAGTERASEELSAGGRTPSALDLVVGPDGTREILAASDDAIAYYVEAPSSWPVQRSVSGVSASFLRMLRNASGVPLLFSSAYGLGRYHDLSTGAESSLPGVADALRAGDLIVAAIEETLTLDGSSLDRAAVELFSLTADGASSTQEVWKHEANRRYLLERTVPSLAVDASARVSVVHRSPEGIAWTRETEPGTWQTVTLSADRAIPKAIIDGDGKLHVYFLSDSDWDGSPDQLRRVREGTCLN